MNFIIDIIVLAIVVITALISAKRGFAATIIELVGCVLVLTLSTFVGNYVAEKIYVESIEKPIVESVGKTIEKTGDKTLNIDEVWNSIPDIGKTALKTFNITKESLEEKYDNTISLKGNAKIDAQNSSKKIAGEIIKPLFTKLISLFVSTILFMILSVLVRLLASTITRVINLTFAKKLNRDLGLVFGIPKGILYAFIFCVVLVILVSLTQNGFWIFTKNAVDKSFSIKGARYLVKYISPIKYIKKIISL